jgi:hypothetical protein
VPLGIGGASGEEGARHLLPSLEIKVKKEKKEGKKEKRENKEICHI